MFQRYFLYVVIFCAVQNFLFSEEAEPINDSRWSSEEEWFTQWETDVQKALKRAQDENKDIVVHITTLKGCSNTLKLKYWVFSNKELMTRLSDRFVLFKYVYDNSHQKAQEKSEIELLFQTPFSPGSLYLCDGETGQCYARIKGRYGWQVEDYWRRVESRFNDKGKQEIYYKELSENEDEEKEKRKEMLEKFLYQVFMNDYFSFSVMRLKGEPPLFPYMKELAEFCDYDNVDVKYRKQYVKFLKPSEKRDEQLKKISEAETNQAKKSMLPVKKSRGEDRRIYDWLNARSHDIKKDQSFNIGLKLSRNYEPGIGVVEVAPGSLAEKAGLKQGDFIGLAGVQLNKLKVVMTVKEIANIIETVDQGDDLYFGILRDGKRLNVKLELHH